jgi:hypothetical protein
VAAEAASAPMGEITETTCKSCLFQVLGPFIQARCEEKKYVRPMPP